MTTWTAQQYQSYLATAKTKRQPIIAFGQTFGSLAEQRRWIVNLERQQAGEIQNLRKGPRLVIREHYTDAHGRQHGAAHYTPDQAYELVATGVTVYEEVKPTNPNAPSRRRRDWQLRMEAAQLLYPAARFDVVYC